MARKSVLIGVSLFSAAAASGVTWYFTKRILEQQYEDRIHEEITASVKHILKEMGISVVVSDEDPDILASEMNEEAINEQVEIIVGEQEYSGTEEKDISVSEQLDVVEAELDAFEEKLDEIEGERVFGSQEEKPPLEDLAARNQTTPYHKIMTPDVEETPEPIEVPEPEPEDPDISVISRDIFLENATEWEQGSLTYFADDGVLDENGDFIEDHFKLIGPGRPRFGQLSGDPKVVYVKNRRLEREYEIVSDEGNASEFLAHSLGEMYKPERLR